MVNIYNGTRYCETYSTESKIVPNQRTESDSESEEGEIEDDESDFENHVTSEKDGCYRPVATSPEDEFNLHTDGEINTGEKKLKNNTTENEGTRRSNRESRQPNRYGLHIQKNSGCDFKTKLLQVKDGTSEKSPRNH